MHISQEVFEKVNGLYRQSLHLQAYHEAIKTAPLGEWENTEAKILASNIAYNLGSLKDSAKWTKQAWRRDKFHPRALFSNANEIFHRRGALPALLFIKKYGDKFSAEGDLLSWWYAMRAEIYAQLRDFTTADEWLKKALEIAPREPWVWTARSLIFERQDRYAEALEASRHALELRPWYRGAVFQYAHLLILLERYDEALKILQESGKHIENAWVVKLLANLQIELGLFKEAEKSYERIFELTPLRDEEAEKWLFGGISDLAYLNGDLKKAIEYAEKSAGEFHKKIKENLENLKGTEKRVLLNLGFIRQHHVTCAPATIANISRFWKKKAEHLSVAEEICYNGTPAYKERLWAVKNDWETREFTVNWDDTIKLIDRGIPFTLATVHPGNGHLQAVIGYDERRRTFIVRDPFYQDKIEYAADELLKEQAANGPRGMALVPKENAGLLKDLNLSDSRIYDLVFRFDNALSEYDRKTAAETLSEIEREFPDHRMTLSSKWSLARYDANELEMLAAIEKLREKFPEDINLKMSYVNLSASHKSRAERLETLEKFSAGKKSDPLLWQMFGYELSLEPKEDRRALHWLYKSIRALPTAPFAFRLIADIFWGRREFAEATELYRFAASLDDKDEQFAYSYFAAARYQKEGEKALKVLRDRYALFGHLSAKPVESLFHALRELGRAGEAFDVLEDALKKRPDDGELKIFAAESKARYGKQKEAEELIDQAESKTQRAHWLRASALMAEISGNLKRALENWREIVAQQPLAYDAHENIAFLLTAVESRAAAQNHLRKITEEFPFNVNLQKLRLSYLREEGEESQKILRHLQQISPQDLWIDREIVRWLIHDGKKDEAAKMSEQIVRRDPNDPANHWCSGWAYSKLGKYEDSVVAFHKAISLSVDADYAINGWLEVCRTGKERIAALNFVRGELFKQTNFGEGLRAYREQGRRILPPEKLLENLRQIFDENRESWFVWSVLIEQLVDMMRLDEAKDLAVQATEKYPLLPQIWFDLSLVFKLRGDNEQEIECLRKALAINRNWSYGIRQYTDALLRSGRFEEAVTELRKAVARLPLDYVLHGFLADALWKTGEKQKAIEAARKAVTLEPEYDWAWQSLKIWGEEEKQPDLAAEMARELTIRKPNDARSWTTYARLLDTGQFSQAQLDAAEQALKLEPQNDTALSMKANSLADARRFDEAIEVCKTSFASGYRPERLRFTQAGIEAARGNYDEALRVLERLGADSPDYYAVWERLAGIYRNQENKKIDYMRVSKNMTRLAPQEPTTYGFYGEACLLNGKRDEAKQALAQALMLSPDYDFAGATLFDLYLEDNEMEKCRETLKTLTTFLKNDQSLVREIVFYAKTGELEKCESLLHKLYLSENATRYDFNYVFKNLREAKLIDKDFIWNALRDAAKSDSANPLIGAYLIEHIWEKQGEKACRETLSTLRSNPKVWGKAVDKFYELLLKEFKTSEIESFIKQNEAALKSNDDAWASTGYALISIKKYERCAAWFADWDKREKIEPWMLYNYSNALRYIGENGKARFVSQKALEIKPDDSVNVHLTLLGIDEMHAGNYAAAEQIFRQVNPSSFPEWEIFFYNLLRYGLDIKNAADSNAQSETDFLIKEITTYCLSQPKLWKDRIQKDYFEKSFEQILNLSQSAWLKFSLRAKVKLYKTGLLK